MSRGGLALLVLRRCSIAHQSRSIVVLRKSVGRRLLAFSWLHHYTQLYVLHSALVLDISDGLYNGLLILMHHQVSFDQLSGDV